MSNCETCPLESNCDNKESCVIENNSKNHVKHIIGVMSGKGGVGKSTVAVLLARQLKKQGYSVGVMDADISGPSIPRLLNISHKRAQGSDEGIIPVLTADGIKVISLNLLLEAEDQPVIWRGPLIAGAVKQFWTDVLWGDLDYLIIDMPPGTADVALTVMQSIPLSGVVMVSVPQDMVSMIVAKAVNMANEMKTRILGVVENMSYIQCPNCGEKIRLFEGQDVASFLEDMSLQLLGELPMCKEIVAIAKGENPTLSPELEAILASIAEKVLNQL